MFEDNYDDLEAPKNFYMKNKISKKEIIFSCSTLHKCY